MTSIYIKYAGMTGLLILLFATYPNNMSVCYFFWHFKGMAPVCCVFSWDLQLARRKRKLNNFHIIYDSEKKSLSISDYLYCMSVILSRKVGGDDSQILSPSDARLTLLRPFLPNVPPNMLHLNWAF